MYIWVHATCIWGPVKALELGLQTVLVKNSCPVGQKLFLTVETFLHISRICNQDESIFCLVQKQHLKTD